MTESTARTDLSDTFEKNIVCLVEIAFSNIAPLVVTSNFTPFYEKILIGIVIDGFRSFLNFAIMFALRERNLGRKA